MPRIGRRAQPAPPPPAPPTASPAPAEEPAPRALGYEKWMGFLAQFIAPATLVTALLFYFGYVSSRAFFAYFGIDVDILGLSTQAFVMRSPGALFVPVMVLLLLAAALIVAHRLLRRWMQEAWTAATRRAVRAIGVAGAVVMLAGLAMARLLGVLGAWSAYPLLTPLLLAAGAGLTGYAVSTERTVRGSTVGRSVVVILVLVMVAGTFWSAATIAQWWGTGQARTQAADLATLPSVVLDTKERVYPGDPAITFQQLQPSQNQTYLYRYYGLRLLVQGGNRLFLVPDRWSADASTLVVPYDSSVRLRFRFFPDANPSE